MKNKPKKIIPVLLLMLGLAAHPGLAQSEKPPKWELGTDLLFLFDKNQLPDYSLFATRKLGDKGYALRSRVGFDVGNFYPDRQKLSGISDEQNINYLVLIGLEKQINSLSLGEKGNLYSALDIALIKDRKNKQYIGFNDLGDYGFSSDEYYDTRYSLNWSLGFKYRIGKNIAIRLESAISYQHRRVNIDVYRIALDPNDPVPDKKKLMERVKDSYVGGTYYRENFLRLIPINQLLITFKF